MKQHKYERHRPMATVEIYGLYDPDSGDLRYVGKANNAKSRLARHLNEAKHLDRPICLWIRGLLADGKIPLMSVLQVVPHEDWKESERGLIAEFRKTCNLLNLAPGGDMPSQTREQSQNAARAAWKASNSTPAKAAFNKAKREAGRHLAQLAKDGAWTDYYVMRLTLKCRAADRPDLYPSWLDL